jgi:hypothetical protein
MQPARYEPISMAMQQHGGRTKVLAPLQEPPPDRRPAFIRGSEATPNEDWDGELPCSFQPG